MAERIRVTQRFSGFGPLPTIPRLKGPAIYRLWEDPKDAGARLDLSRVCPDGHRHRLSVDPSFAGICRCGSR